MSEWTERNHYSSYVTGKRPPTIEEVQQPEIKKRLEQLAMKYADKVVVLSTPPGRANMVEMSSIQLDDVGTPKLLPHSFTQHNVLYSGGRVAAPIRKIDAHHLKPFARFKSWHKTEHDPSHPIGEKVGKINDFKPSLCEVLAYVPEEALAKATAIAISPVATFEGNGVQTSYVSLYEGELGRQEEAKTALTFEKGVEKKGLANILRAGLLPEDEERVRVRKKDTPAVR